MLTKLLKHVWFEFRLQKLKTLLTNSSAFESGSDSIRFERCDNMLEVYCGEVYILTLELSPDSNAIMISHSIAQLEVFTDQIVMIRLLARLLQVTSATLHRKGGLRVFHSDNTFYLLWQRQMPKGANFSQATFNAFLLSTISYINNTIRPTIEYHIDNYQLVLDKENNDMAAVESEFNVTDSET